MLYREAGQFKSTYAQDQQIFPIRQDRIAVLVLLVFAFVVVPIVGDQYWLGAIITPFLILALATLGLNILTGYAGQLSLGTGGHAHRPSVAATIYSDDEGTTWKSGEIALPNQGDFTIPNETAAVQLANGDVITDSMPDTPLLYQVTPIYEEWEGWQESTANCRHWDDLPKAAADIQRKPVRGSGLMPLL